MVVTIVIIMVFYHFHTHKCTFEEFVQNCFKLLLFDKSWFLNNIGFI